MSKKLYEAFDRLLAGDEAGADRLMHEHIIEQSKNIYRELSEADEFSLEDEMSDVSVDGDQSEDFVDEISDDEYEIENDELNAGEVEAEGSMDDEQSEQIADIQGKLEELMNAFNTLVAAEQDEPHHADDDLEEVNFDDMDSAGDDEEVESDEEMEDDSEDLENVKESVSVKTVSIEKPTEGKFVGTGKNSKSGSVNTKSTLGDQGKAGAPAGSAVKFGGGDEKGFKAQGGKSVAVSTDPKVKNVNDGAEVGEGGFVGTGKNTPGAKAVNKTSVLKPVKKS